MKKLVIAAISLAIVASAASAQVTSRNAVGYVKVDTVRSNLYMLSHNFFDLNGNPTTVSNVFGTQVPIGSQVLLWDAFASPAPKYVAASRTIGGWSPPTNQVPFGRGFWLRIPGTAVSNNYTVYLMGEVPDKFTAPGITNPVAAGLNMLGYAYPVATYWTNTALAKSAPIASQILRWNGTYIAAAKTVGGWSPNNFVLQPGEGFWFRTTSATNWVEVKPYQWP